MGTEFRIMKLDYFVEQDSFDKNLKNCMRNLYETSEHSDVTIVCDDNKLIKCHKFILSEYSQVFKNILSGADINNPMIIIKEASYNHLKSLLQFVYTGETAVSHSDLKAVNKLANDFQLNAWETVLKDSELLTEEKNRIPSNPVTKRNEITISPRCDDIKDNKITDTKDLNEVSIGNNIQLEKPTKEEKESAVDDQLPNVTPARNDKEKNKSSKCTRCFGFFENYQKLMSHMFICTEFLCTRCNHKANSYSDLKKHTKEEHMYSLEQCTECDAVVNKTYIRRHIKEVHEQKLRKCKFCDYQHKNYSSIKQHEKAKHDGVTYPCTYCDYITKTKHYLHRHVAIHEGIKFPCQQCEYKAQGKQNLDAHVKYVHKKMRVHCDQCGYQTQRKSQLEKHINRNHN